MYDLLIVGAGITGATLCAAVKDRWRVCVIDVRNHIGGNCHDYRSQGTFIHSYGPHVFHSASEGPVEFLSKYTRWQPYVHSVDAEIEHHGDLVRVPFPYCKQTQDALGGPLTEKEVLERFFFGYSRKMWGVEWDQLPTSVKGRVPKEVKDRSEYYPGHFVAMPADGYTRMFENMFDGAELVLGAGAHEWQDVPWCRIAFTGRPDHIRLPGESVSFGDRNALSLEFRSLDIRFTTESYSGSAPCLNYCSIQRPEIRRTQYSKLTGGKSQVASYETPYQASQNELAPYYPVPTSENIEKHRQLCRLVEAAYPNLTLCGRLGSYKYLDMYQAVGQALAIAKGKFLL